MPIGMTGTLTISIHAPREGSDMEPFSCALCQNISIHAPREGSDRKGQESYIGVAISIHAPREGSDLIRCHNSNRLQISIHAPREGSDGSYKSPLPECARFQSTLPVRGATCGTSAAEMPGYRFQSTLPVRGATCRSPPDRRCSPHFNPRSP